MKRSVAVAALGALALLVLAACGGGAEPARLPELEAEVRAAAQALLDAPGFDATAVRRGEDGAVSRVDWVHWLASGDYRHATAGRPVSGAEPSVFGLVQVGADLFAARLGPVGDEAWARRDDGPTERVPLPLELEAIAGGTTSPVADVEGGAELAREMGPGGDVRWVVDAPLRGDRLVQTWVVGGDGALRSYTVRTAGGSVIQDGTTAVDYGFTPLADPAPVAPPPLGAPLDTTELGVPPDLPLLGP